MAKTNLYEVIVYYDDGTKDLREWADEMHLACQDYLRLSVLPNVVRCELRCIRHGCFNYVAVFDRNAV